MRQIRKARRSFAIHPVSTLSCFRTGGVPGGIGKLDDEIAVGGQHLAARAHVIPEMEQGLGPSRKHISEALSGATTASWVVR